MEMMMEMTRFFGKMQQFVIFLGVFLPLFSCFFEKFLL